MKVSDKQNIANDYWIEYVAKSKQLDKMKYDLMMDRRERDNPEKIELRAKIEELHDTVRCLWKSYCLFKSV